MDKIIIFSVIVIFIIVLFVNFNVSEDSEECIIGIADNQITKENGYTYNIMISDGSIIRAYSSFKIDNELHSFKGNYSSDKNIFFISEII